MGHRKEAARRSTQSEEEKDTGATATLTGQWSQTDRRREDREDIQDVFSRALKQRLDDSTTILITVIFLTSQ